MLKAFAVRDMKAESFGIPMWFTTRGLALRAFADACADARSPMCQHPEDYMLFELGSYEQTSGKFESLEIPALVASASSVVEQLRISREPKAPEVVNKEV